MKKILPSFLIFAVGIIAMASSFAQKSDTILLKEVEIKRLKALVDADIDMASSLHADNFELINPLGQSFSKEEYLSKIESGQHDYITFEPISPMKVYVSGDQAVLRYKSKIELIIQQNKLPIREHWHTDVYQKIGGHWKIVWSHATMIK